MKHKKRVTQKEIKLVYQLSAIRMPTNQIAEIIGISKSTFERMIHTNNNLRDALESGRNDASHKVRATLFELATRREVEIQRETIKVDAQGNIIDRKTTVMKKRVDPEFKALEFWCKTQEGMRPVSALEISGPNGSPIKTEYNTAEEIISRIKELGDLDEIEP